MSLLFQFIFKSINFVLSKTTIIIIIETMSHIVRYKSVCLRRKEFEVIRDADFTIDKGEYIYLTGKVGSGKSTLLKSMYADVPIESGEALVLDYDLSRIKKRDIPYLRRRIGFVFQDFQLLMDRSVYSNLEFVMKATGWKNKTDINERIEKVLTSVGMTNKSYKMPHELSGGEQQRIVIARALLNNPDLILADEPTGNLDPEAGEHVISLLHDISKSGTAVVIATHNQYLITTFPGKTLRCEDKQLIFK